jgi:2-methylisocitrate lyase-like PEP mutase family enzyme
VAATIAEAVAIGAVGANVEDVDDTTGALLAPDVAAERIAAARSAAPVGTFVLNARIDSYLRGAAVPFDDVVERAERYVAAGADCIFVPGIDDPATISSVVDAVGAPLNVVAGLTERVLDASTLRSRGVARISVGGSLARATLGFVERAGRDLLAGTFGHVEGAISHGRLQRRFASTS